MKKIFAVILMIVTLIGTLNVAAFAEGRMQCCISPYPATQNLSNGPLPDGCNTVRKNEQIYVNLACTSDLKIKSVELYYVESGDTEWHCQDVETAQNYMRYVYFPFTPRQTGKLRFYLRITMTDGHVFEGEVDANVEEAKDAQAKQTNSRNGIQSKLRELESIYTNGSRWYDTFDGSSQCAGYARMIQYNLYGCDYWLNNGNGRIKKIKDKSYLWNGLKPGDYVRYKNDGHSVIITAVYGDGTCEITDCNSDWNCTVRWHEVINISRLENGFSWVYSAQW